MFSKPWRRLSEYRQPFKKRNEDAYLCVLLVLLLSVLSGRAVYPGFVEQLRGNEVVMDAWERGRRAQEMGQYQRAKEGYYFVKRFATTYYLQIVAQKRYEAVSRILGQPEGQD